uniref:Uncharacterized protein n=1 Tax=Elphidium margaritaceum TaxID=933848 RepID=A0A7S0TBY2_9EUKA|mmetsp:Transcript_1759/g.3454  ORF Transcript_1759/g.3454 Transcript_1759/m.3454 type:complete len:234 (+) Transcript_1759:53-754(+)|eukprot:CAMPEP_0202691164 /NCGR_PEP_ID=MMETSP1385-20130828/5952_1 /ASSEMBLY_ACC=CAM_ASM_000861 /TAXON_ID=933848 /ORGANISM="Elphidium margaritaceum" /LENGTH=233 /DNA_ID=CAMNT_0049346525 /DNA_START=50 /DNA_END=751 /DNA_ORIENTATION=+
MALPEKTATIDPDREWALGNPDYKAISWYSSADGRFEEKLARESPLDSFSGLNYNKIARGDNEYYGSTTAPLYAYEFDEDAYYREFQPVKSDEQVQTELNEPVEKFEAKLKEFVDKGEELVWTPAMEEMARGCPIAPARAIQYEISPYFQLNTDGYRKHWANTRLVEFRPMLRMQQKWMNTSSDFFFRFQIMRWNLSSKIRMRYWKMVASGVYFGLLIDHFWARQYKRKFKWH